MQTNARASATRRRPTKSRGGGRKGLLPTDVVRRPVPLQPVAPRLPAAPSPTRHQPSAWQNPAAPAPALHTAGAQCGCGGIAGFAPVAWRAIRFYLATTHGRMPQPRTPASLAHSPPHLLKIIATTGLDSFPRTGRSGGLPRLPSALLEGGVPHIRGGILQIDRSTGRQVGKQTARQIDKQGGVGWMRLRRVCALKRGATGLLDGR